MKRFFYLILFISIFALGSSPFSGGPISGGGGGGIVSGSVTGLTELGADTITDGTLTISGGNLTTPGTVSAGTLTDGTLSITDGNLTTTGTIAGSDFSGITAGMVADLIWEEDKSIAVYGGGSAIASNSPNTTVVYNIGYDLTLIGYHIATNQGTNCSIVFDVLVGANLSALSSIVANAPPTLSDAQEIITSTLTGWSPNIAANSDVQIKVTSADCVGGVSLTLKGVRGI
jgi:hypothetical protein